MGGPPGAESAPRGGCRVSVSAFARVTFLLWLEVLATELTRTAVFPPYVLRLACREHLGVPAAAPDPPAAACEAAPVVAAGNALLLRATLGWV